MPSPERDNSNVSYLKIALLIILIVIIVYIIMGNKQNQENFAMTLPITSLPYAYYDVSSFNNNIWSDLSGNNYNANKITGTITKSSNYISGTKDTNITFPTAVLPKNYTLFTLAKYNGNSSNIIFQGTNSNWFSGFNNNAAGVAYHSNWITNQNNKFGKGWVLSVDQYSNYRANLENLTLYPNKNPVNNSINLAVNSGNYPNSSSDYAIALVIVFDSVLNLNDIKKMENFIVNKYSDLLSNLVNKVIPVLNPVNVLGIYGIAPWYKYINFPDSNAKWIWTNNKNTTNIFDFLYINNSSSNINATINSYSSQLVTSYLNGKIINNSNNNTLSTYNSTIIPGENVFSFLCKSPSSTVTNMILAGGSGVNTICYSTDGINWASSNNGSQVLSLCNSIIWNGIMWLAVGQGSTSNIAYSMDGMNWFSGNTSINGVMSICNCIVWNGTVYVAGGTPTTQGSSLAYSTDGYNWFASKNGTQVLPVDCMSIACSNNLFVALGNSNWLYYPYSTDGITWTQNYMYIQGSTVNKVYYSGKMWFFSWQLNSNQTMVSRILYSNDGKTWSETTGTNNYNLGPCSFAYNGTQYVSGSSWITRPEGSSFIYTSTNGISWTGDFNSINSAIPTAYSKLALIAWNGNIWIYATLNQIAYGTNSSTGISWKLASFGTLFSKGNVTCLSVQKIPDFLNYTPPNGLIVSVNNNQKVIFNSSYTWYYS